MQSALVSMVLFTLIGGITPGPVNVIASNLGARLGWAGAWPHVLGASLGYVAVVGLMGAGLQIALEHAPSLSRTIQWMGAAYLLYRAFRIGTAVPRGLPGADGAEQPAVQPRWNGLRSGFLTQTLNPKGWLVSMSGVGMFVAGSPDEALYLTLFSAISLVICFAAVSVWAGLGVLIKGWLCDALHERWFNRLCALGLALCVLPMVRMA